MQATSAMLVEGLRKEQPVPTMRSSSRVPVVATKATSVSKFHFGHQRGVELGEDAASQ